MAEPILELRAVEKFYGPAQARIQVVAPTDLAVYPGEIRLRAAHSRPLACPLARR